MNYNFYVQKKLTGTLIMLFNSALLILRLLFLVIMVFSCLLILPSNSWARSTHNFTHGSLEKIVNSRKGHPFVLVFWSLECPPCLKELVFFHEQLTLHPEMDLVMVSTDDSNRKEEVEVILVKYNLDTFIESWIFSDASVEKLRYEVDPSWFGEMPRSYFYDSEHNTKALSGTVTKDHFDNWRSSAR